MLWTEREGGSKHMLTGDDVREYAHHEHYSMHNPSYRSMKRSAHESSILCLISEWHNRMDMRINNSGRCTTPTTWWDLIGAAEGIFSNGLGCSSPYTDASVSWKPLALCHATHPYPPYQSGELEDTCILRCSDLENLLVYVLQSLQDFGLLSLCTMGVSESLCQDLFLF